MNNYNSSRILIVDDQEEDLEILNHILEKQDYQLSRARNGKEALEIVMEDKKFDAIVIDRMMPIMDGMGFIHRMRQIPELLHIPVIMQTAANSEQQISEGIEAGVYWYITKPFSHQILVQIVKSALRFHKKHQKISEITDYYIKRRKMLKNGLEKLKICEFEFQDLEDSNDVAHAISCCFPNPRNIYGACSELLINAVEHGNLGINFSEKSTLLLDGKWKDEINYRKKLDEYKDRKVNVRLERDDNSLKITVKDDGEGFDWEPFMDLDPYRAHKLNGRGIYLAGLEFDNIEYLGKGNEVVCTQYLN